MRFTCSLVLGLLLLGCGQYPNPNDLRTAAPSDQVNIAHELLVQATDSLAVKVQKGMMTDQGRLDKIREYSEELLGQIDQKTVPPSDDWMLAGLLRSTGRWKEAEVALTRAVKFAKDEDRRINDTLRLAEAMAHNGKVEEGIATVRKTFNAKDEDTAPILLSTLYEFTPAAEKKGFDKQIADLLEGAIECHMRTKVDPNTEEGKLFGVAARYHINKARTKIAQLRSGL